MKKQEVVDLINHGIQFVSAHDLGPEHAYKVFQLKRAIHKAHEQIEDERNTILKDAGLDDQMRQKLSDIDTKRRKKEKLTSEDEKTLDTANAAQVKANRLLEQLYKDNICIDVKTVPYDVWRELQKENRNKLIGDREVDLLGGPVEVILADVFWLGPEADSPAKEEPKKSKK